MAADAARDHPPGAASSSADPVSRRSNGVGPVSETSTNTGAAAEKRRPLLDERCGHGSPVPAVRAVGHDAGMPPTLRIGVLGAGPIAQFAHFEACRKAANAELYAICDLAPDLLEQVAAEHRPRRTFASYDDMLADSEVDAVIVAIADQFHVQAALQALAAGKDVLVEKPMGVTVEECERLCAAVEASGRTLQVGTMRRFDPALQFAERFVREELGDVVALKAWYCDSAYRYTMTDALQPIPHTSAQARRPSGNPKADVERYAMLGHGSHLIDLALWLAGDIVSVSAQLVRRGDLCRGSWPATSRAVPPATST